MKRSSIVATVVVAITLSGCSGDGPTDPGGNDGGNSLTGAIKATIDGSPWASPVQFTTAAYTASSNTYLIVGAEQAVGGRALLINLSSVPGPGTYSLPSSLPFRYANTTSGTQVWETNVGTTGTVVVTTATPTRFVGTFSFTARPTSSNPAGNTVNVTNGSFDVTIPQ